MEDPVDAEDVGDEVVGEGGEVLEAGEVGDPGAVEIRSGELGSLKDGDLAAVVAGDVGEGVPGGEGGGESWDRVRYCSRAEKAVLVLAADVVCDIAERSGELPHQRVFGVLAHYLGNRLLVHPL